MDGLATGGPIDAGKVSVIGKDGCGLMRPAAGYRPNRHGCDDPANITIDIPRIALGEDDWACIDEFARVVNEQIIHGWVHDWIFGKSRRRSEAEPAN